MVLASIGLCCVPLSIAVCETFLSAALVFRLAGFLRDPESIRPPRLFWLWLVWIALEVTSWVRSPDLGAGLGEMRHLLLMVALFITIPAMKHPDDYVRVWRGIFVAATIGSLSLIVNFYILTVRHQQDLMKGGDPSFYLRTGGFLHHWAIFGTVEIIVFSALLEYRTLYRAGRWTQLMLGVQILAISLSLTRSLWCAAVLIGLAHVLRTRSKWIWGIPSVFLIAMLLSPHVIGHRLKQAFDADYYSNAERLQMWRVGLRMIRKAPLFGVGPGRSEKLYSQFLVKGEPMPAYHGHLHNNGLQLGAEFGLIVLSAAVVFVCALIREVHIACKRARSREECFLAYSAMNSVGGFLIMGLTDYTYGHALGLILITFAVSPALLPHRGEHSAVLERQKDAA